MSKPETKKQEWVFFNDLTMTYDTPDGTKVAAELIDNAQCLADVLYIAIIRQEQRDAIKKATEQ